MAIQLQGDCSNGKPNDWGELCFAANGAVSAAGRNVTLRIETYDGAAGQVIAAYQSGINTAGPLQGAYDGAS